jgi:hypothetical protein
MDISIKKKSSWIFEFLPTQAYSSTLSLSAHRKLAVLYAGVELAMEIKPKLATNWNNLMYHKKS